MCKVIFFNMQKNIKKAITIADYLIEAHIKNAAGMEELVKNWTTGSKGLGLEIASVHRDVAKCIEMIKECLEEKPKRSKIVSSNS